MKKRNSYSRFIQRIKDWEKGSENLVKGKVINLLHHCVENDITSFDCSDFPVNNGNKSFGPALSESGLSRDKIQLISGLKLSGNHQDPVAQVDDMLLDLKTDYLDLLLLDHTSRPEKLLEDIRKLTSQGKIIEVGGWHLDRAQLKTYSEIFPIRAVLSDWNSFSGTEMDQGPRELSSSNDIVQMLQYDARSLEAAGKNPVLEEIASKYKVDPSRLILAWLLQHSSHLHPVISTDSEESISITVEAKKVKLTPVDLQKLNHLLT